MAKLDINSLETWLWDCACKIRGDIDAPKYKDYILPLIFLKRLSDVFEDETADIDKKLVEADHSLVWFYLPPKSRWEEIIKQSTKLGEFLTDAVRAIAQENPKLQGVIDIVDFNATQAGQRVISDDKLKLLVDTLSKYRLGLHDVEPDILGRAYEYLLRKFAEGSGQSAGEFYTPREVAVLMARILDPQQGDEVYDPCLGSGGLLIKTHIHFLSKFGSNTQIKPLQFFGQEYIHSTFAMAKMNAFIHRMEAEIALGDSMNKPAFKSATGSLKKFDIVVANPMWNQNFVQKTYEDDTFNRFDYGYPPSSSADWGWIQHMFASLKDKGRMAVILDTGAVSRGSGNTGANRERDIRKEFVDKDYIEGIILLPENLFYNTTAPGVILFINKKKQNAGEINLLNASKLFEKGRPKNFLPEHCINQIVDIYEKWENTDEISMVVSKEDVVKNDYNLSPSRYVSQNGEDDTLPLEEAIVLLKEAEEERVEADSKLKNVLEQLGL